MKHRFYFGINTIYCGCIKSKTQYIVFLLIEMGNIRWIKNFLMR